MTIKQLTYKDATGSIPFNMTNDYMFRVVLQKNDYVLKGLICSLLHLNHEDVQSTQITNPIELGDYIDEKTFVLDINVILNNASLINLEMQMKNGHLRCPFFEEFSYENVYNKKGMFVKAFSTFTSVSITTKCVKHMSIFKNISKIE